MKKHRKIILIVAVCALAAVVLVLSFRRKSIVLTGIVTTDEVVVSSEIQGRLEQLSVQQGDLVKKGQVVAVVAPAESKADLAYFENVERSAAAQVAQAESELAFQQILTTEQIHQAEAGLASAQAQATQAKADLEIAQLNFERSKSLRDSGANSAQDFDLARTSFDSAKARDEAARQQVSSAEAALSVAKAGAAQISVRQSALASSKEQLGAATAQKEKSGVRYSYTQIAAPANGVVNIRAALQGEVVNPGQAIVTLIDPDNLWIRADVEESYIDRIRIGDTYTIRLPSGTERKGTVIFRGIDADYATQRDVSRTKRDIKTFEIRLRCDNADRSLAVGMTAYVEFTLGR